MTAGRKRYALTKPVLRYAEGPDSFAHLIRLFGVPQNRLGLYCDVPVLHQHHYDVAVIGGGPAGVTASKAASACGAANVALIESSSQLGGSVTAAMHRSLCGLYSHAPQNPIDTLNDGGQREIIAAMVRADSSGVVPRLMGKAWVLEFSASAWETALAAHCDQPNIYRMIGCRVEAVERAGGKITGLVVRRNENMTSAKPQAAEIINPTIVIDCTGGGHILSLIGDDVALPEEPVGRMLGGFSVKLSGLTGDLESLRLRVPFVLAKAVSSGILPVEAKFTMFHPGPDAGEGICKLAVNPDHFASGEVDLFTQQVIDCLRTQIDSFAKADVSQTSPRTLARDGKRLRGKVIVTEDDVLQGRQIGPEAVHAWWPIERWDLSTGPRYNYPPQGRHYDIPDGALQSAIVHNLLAAGTCVSATSAASASLRVSGVCLATGHAAGRLAAAMLT